MRRRPKEVADVDLPPASLRTFTGATSRQKLAWLDARDQWWHDTKNDDDPGWLDWLLDGYEQVDPMPWCGSIGDPCGDADCMCIVWPEYLQAQSKGT